MDFFELLPAHIRNSDHSQSYRMACDLLNYRYNIAKGGISELIDSKSAWKADDTRLVSNAQSLGLTNLGVFPSTNRRMLTEAAGHLRRVKGTKRALESVLHALGIVVTLKEIWSSYAVPYTQHLESSLNDEYFRYESDLPHVVDGQANPAVLSIREDNVTWTLLEDYTGGTKIVNVSLQGTKRAKPGQKLLFQNYPQEFEVESYNPDTGTITLTTAVPSTFSASADSFIYVFWPDRVYATSLFDVIVNDEDDIASVRRYINIVNQWKPLRSRMRRVIFEEAVIPTVYTSNQEFTAECPEGTLGDPVTREGVATSIISQADADQNALNAAMALAYADLICVVDDSLEGGVVELTFLADGGDSSEAVFEDLTAYLLSHSDREGVLLGGNMNYPAGNPSTSYANLLPFEGWIQSGKAWPTFGSRDLEYKSLAFEGDLTLKEFSSSWRWTSSNAFSSNWISDWSVSSGWGVVAGGVPGFGQPDNSLGTLPNDEGITHYFVSKFSSLEPVEGQRVKLRMLIDDGARVFINGTKVYDFNLKYPLSDTSESQYDVGMSASQGVWNQRTMHEILIDATILEEGADNIIAAEIHQSSSSSSDMAWDCMIEIGSSDDHVPNLDNELNFSDGYGQPLVNLFSYIENGCKFYHKEIGNFDLFVLNSGLNLSGRVVSPSWNNEVSLMHSWFLEALEASEKPFKVVMFHHPYVGFHPNYAAAMDWEEFKSPNFLLLNGNSLQSFHLTHSSGMHVVNASCTVKSNPLLTLGGNSSGFSTQYSNSSEPAVCKLRCESDNELIVSFEKISDSSTLHQFSMLS